jgi:SAM-dependent methyltransferase
MERHKRSSTILKGAGMPPTLSDAKWRRTVREQWNEASRAWERWEPFIFSFLHPVDPVLLRALRLSPGQRVLDFGCGSGEPALQIARWIGPRGKVVGLDVAAPMLEIARRRAHLLGIDNVTFRRGDIARLPLRGPFDRVCSRFGIMFVDDVPRALDHARRALKPGGRAVLSVWGPLERNPALTLTMKAIQPFLETPPPDFEHSPNPMRLARPGLLPRLMRAAGFREVRVAHVPTYAAYPDAEFYVSSMLERAELLRAVYGTLSPAQQQRVRTRLARDVRRFPSGHAIRIPGHAWVISARR